MFDSYGRTARPGEVYAFYAEMSGKYGACQILAVDSKSICYVLLDYLEDVLPREDMLERLKPYHRESFRYHHQMIKTGIENTPVPRDSKNAGSQALPDRYKGAGYGAGDMEALEGLHELRELDLDSIPKEAGLYLKKHWKGKLDRLNVAHLREDGWLKDIWRIPSAIGTEIFYALEYCYHIWDKCF